MNFKGEVPRNFDPFFHPGSFGKLVGPYYHKELPDGTFIRGFLAAKKHINQVGIVQGGMLSTFADHLMTATLIRAGLEGVTVNLNINYLRAARRGDWIEGRSEISKEGTKIVWVNCDLRCNDKLIVTAQGLWQKIDLGKRLREKSA